jgi:hypothetical protein
MKGRSRKSGTKRKFNEAGPSDRVLDYRGPLKIPRGIEQDQPVLANLFVQLALASGAGGVIATEYDDGMSAYAGWGAYSANYDEYRVLGIQVEYFPNNRYSKTTVTCTPVFSVVDRDSTGVLTSATQATSYESCRILSLEDPWTDRRDYAGSACQPIQLHMRGVRDAAYITTATTTPTKAIKLYASGLSVSTTYGLIFVTALVQFRGKI